MADSLKPVACCRPRAEYATGRFSWRANTGVPTGTVAMKPSSPQASTAEDNASPPAALPRPRASVWQQRPSRATPPPAVRPPVRLVLSMRSVALFGYPDPRIAAVLQLEAFTAAGSPRPGAAMWAAACYKEPRSGLQCKCLMPPSYATMYLSCSPSPKC